MRRDSQAVGHDPIESNLLDLLELLPRPLAYRRKLLVVHAAPLSLGRKIADGRRTLLRYERPMLIAMDRIAQREHGRSGELRIGHLVAVKTPLMRMFVTRPDARAVKPPFLAAEDQMRARNAAHTGRRHPVIVIHGNHEGLRRDQASKLRPARVLLIPMDWVW